MDVGLVRNSAVTGLAAAMVCVGGCGGRGIVECSRPFEARKQTSRQEVVEIRFPTIVIGREASLLERH